MKLKLLYYKYDNKYHIKVNIEGGGVALFFTEVPKNTLLSKIR